MKIGGVRSFFAMMAGLAASAPTIAEVEMLSPNPVLDVGFHGRSMLQAGGNYHYPAPFLGRPKSRRTPWRCRSGNARRHATGRRRNPTSKSRKSRR